jgi:hypothetical protein
MQDETIEILEITYKERKHWQHVPVKVPVLSMYLNIKANDNYCSPEGLCTSTGTDPSPSDSRVTSPRLSIAAAGLRAYCIAPTLHRLVVLVVVVEAATASYYCRE